MALLRADGHPREALLHLASRHGIEVTQSMTAQELLGLTQHCWLRQTEHQYQIPGGPPSDEDFAALQELGMVEEVVVPAGQYAGAFVCGATRPAVIKRLAHLVGEHYNGVSLSTVYLWGGARPLNTDTENPIALCTPGWLPFKKGWTPPAILPTTEAGMERLVFEQSDLSPWQGIFIDTPRQETPDGKGRDPNTTDTAKEMMKTNPPSPGTYLLVSNQPYIARQVFNVRAVLPDDIKIIGIGYAAAPTLALNKFLDEVARLLHEEVKRIS